MPSINVELRRFYHVLSDGKAIIFYKGRGGEEVFISGELDEKSLSSLFEEKTDFQSFFHIDDFEKQYVTEEEMAEIISSCMERIEIGHDVDGHGESFSISDWTKINFGFLYSTRVTANKTTISFEDNEVKVSCSSLSELKMYISKRMMEQAKKENLVRSDYGFYGFYVDRIKIDFSDVESVTASFRD
jgi:hypothetical protein